MVARRENTDGLGARRASRELPSSTHINLVPRRRRAASPLRVVAVALALAVGVVAFVKFGVIDYRASVRSHEQALAQAQSELAELESKLVDYDRVKVEYESYEVSGLEASDATGPTLEALALVERDVAPVAAVSSVSLEDGVLRLELGEASLEQVGALVQTLSRRSIVASVVPQTATGRDGSVVTVVVVTLSTDDDEGGA